MLRIVVLGFESPADEKALLRRCKFLTDADDDTVAAVHSLVIGHLQHEDAATLMIDGATITRNQVRKRHGPSSLSITFLTISAPDQRHRREARVPVAQHLRASAPP